MYSFYLPESRIIMVIIWIYYFHKKGRSHKAVHCICHWRTGVGRCQLNYRQAALRSAYSCVCHLSTVWDYNIREQQIWLQLHTQTEKREKQRRENQKGIFVCVCVCAINTAVTNRRSTLLQDTNPEITHSHHLLPADMKWLVEWLWSDWCCVLSLVSVSMTHTVQEPLRIKHLTFEMVNKCFGIES